MAVREFRKLTTAIITRQMTAFMHDPDAPRPGNPIHSTDGGREYGYKAALIGGVNVYGWATPVILEALGTTWLRNGWIEVAFRRPTYPGDEMTVHILAGSGEEFVLQMDNEEGQHCLLGTLGLGTAPWFDDLHAPAFMPGEELPASLPQLSMANAPVDRDLRPRTVHLSSIEASDFSARMQADANPLYHGDKPLIHPAWLAGQMTRLLHHSYDYGPAIHAKSQIQNLAPAHAGQTLTVTGHCHEVYERKGHHYIVNDGAIWSQPGEELVRLRHTAIFQVAKR
tara:strand:- start:1676 stop:2521 length:846 start_codon:yes stop_codon:yes gene_type:complete